MSRLFVLAFSLVCVQCFLVRDSHRARMVKPLKVEHGQLRESSGPSDFPDRQPLILTPHVEKGEIQKAQEAAKVVGILDNVESYSGYFTVNKTHNRNLFFWYFPAEEQPSDSPVLLWLQGGPGGSSIYGLLQENGPIQLNPNRSTILRPHRWTKKHHVIYIDSPAGTGFSFPVPTGPFGEEEISADLYSALEQFFQLFPHIASNDFYVTGESYGGQYVPSVGYAIHHRNPTGRVKINLKGLIIGNGMIRHNCFAFEEHNYMDYLTQNGLPNLGGEIDPYNYLNGDRPSYSVLNLFLNQKNVQQHIHVGNINYEMFNSRVFIAVVAGDQSFNVVPVVEELLQHYPILYYYGQVDTACPYPPSEAELYKLRWSGYLEFSQAKRQHWKVGDELAGYIKSGGNLSLALVRNAGHMVPMDQPVWGLDLITKFISNELPL